MGAIYSVVMNNQTIIASSEMVTITAATAVTSRASAIRILRAWCSQGATETSEQLGVQICSQVTAFGTFTATTPAAHYLGGAASGITGGTAQAAATSGTDASANAAGTKVTIIADSFNNLNGWLYVPVPEERILVINGQTITLAMVGTATALGNWTAGMTFEELN
jgi:hypothetical protein